MTIKYMEKCGELCQRKIGTTWIVLLGILSVATILSVLIM